MKALERLGFEKRNQTGSHVHLISIRNGKKCLVTVPDHGNKEIPPGTLLSILRQARLNREELIENL
ncbi:MAG: type II toxin-antitoxin system HicA family toxin [Nanoarchaeota archaeon]